MGIFDKLKSAANSYVGSAVNNAVNNIAKTPPITPPPTPSKSDKVPSFIISLNDATNWLIVSLKTIIELKSFCETKSQCIITSNPSINVYTPINLDVKKSGDSLLIKS